MTDRPITQMIIGQVLLVVQVSVPHRFKSEPGFFGRSLESVAGVGQQSRSTDSPLESSDDLWRLHSLRMTVHIGFEVPPPVFFRESASLAATRCIRSSHKPHQRSHSRLSESQSADTSLHWLAGFKPTRFSSWLIIHTPIRNGMLYAISPGYSLRTSAVYGHCRAASDPSEKLASQGHQHSQPAYHLIENRYCVAGDFFSVHHGFLICISV